MHEGLIFEIWVGNDNSVRTTHSVTGYIFVIRWIVEHKTLKNAGYNDFDLDVRVYGI